jgi:hypothetical protein
MIVFFRGIHDVWSHDKYEELMQEEELEKGATQGQEETRPAGALVKEAEMKEEEEEFSGELKEDFVSTELNLDNDPPTDTQQA